MATSTSMPLLSSSVLRTAMPVDFRAQIRARLARLNLKKYWLAEQLNGQVTRSAIYNYLREDKRRSEIGADKLEMILNVLEDAEKKQK